MLKSNIFKCNSKVLLVDPVPKSVADLYQNAEMKRAVQNFEVEFKKMKEADPSGKKAFL